MIRRDGQESGPYPIDTLRDMWRAGQIDDKALFRPFGSDRWLSFVDVEEELIGENAAPPAPPALPMDLQKQSVIQVPQAVVLKRLDIPFSDIFIVVLKTMIALLLASPILVVIALLVMLAVTIVGAVFLAGAK